MSELGICTIHNKPLRNGICPMDALADSLESAKAEAREFSLTQEREELA